MQPLTRRCCSHIRSGSIRTWGKWPSPHSLQNFHIPHSLWLVRRNHNATSRPQRADVVVIGAGPAGIAVVGNFLENIPRAKVVWVDRSFEGGSIGQLYRELPSYSPAGDYLQYALALPTFRDICDASPQPNAITALKELDPEMTCSLNYAADMLKLLTDGLVKRVQPIVGNVTHVVRDTRPRQWTVTLELNPQSGPDQVLLKFQAPMVVYCTGSRPQTMELPVDVSRLTLGTALAASRLAKVLPRDAPRTVAVIGDGHSAVLVLRNLFRMAAVSHPRLRIRWFTRTANLRYAEETAAGVILNENNGLMGEAARFARTMLEGDALETSDARHFITRFVFPSSKDEVERDQMEMDMLREHLKGCDYVIQAIGFTRSRLPEVRAGLAPFRGPVGKPKRLVFNGLTGSFFPNMRERDDVIGLFGAGSAFPELEFTSEGWRQPAMSMWKFMRFLKRMVPQWVIATKEGKFVKREERMAWKKGSIIGEERLGG
ncbi:pyridine nucleotide-disulfide oxidoreductase-domain-containing protein [Achaetomium macrosporum]|uniref:L-ornithine N(5)-monooxygenase [NAD(P)H] n=1 Tax=Achaetomium macrosporum TaxID=79813 RepID=A0AAN7CF48_9PEZI|nr:pyridine nucleotide-disulfide oxidoreductase-domain-containing protein [Achaetomium macrosporum]